MRLHWQEIWRLDSKTQTATSDAETEDTHSPDISGRGLPAVDYRLWIDRYYIAAQRLADESIRYAYLTRIHIHSELLADQRMKRLYGVPLLDSEARGQFIAARCAMERFQTDYALRLACPADGCTARLDLEAAWSCA